MKASVTFQSEDIIPALKLLTGIADCKTELVHYTNGVLFDFDNEGQVNLVATDRVCLTLYTFDLDMTEFAGQWLIQAAHLAKLLKELPTKLDPIRFDFEGESVKVSWRDEFRGCKAMNARFPDYWRIIPELGDHTVGLNPSVLVKATGKDANAVRLQVSSKTSPVLVTDAAASNKLSLIMPVRLDNV
jgi:DNA polymerase III sliding clamp (beta) subunit (PCNA family)